MLNPLMFASASVYEKAANLLKHYSDVIMGTIASQLTNLTIVNSIVYSGAN